MVGEEGEALDRGLIGGAEIETADAVGAIVAGVEGAVGMGRADKKHVDVVMLAAFADTAEEVSCVAHVGDDGAHASGTAQHPYQQHVDRQQDGEEEEDMSQESAHGN